MENLKPKKIPVRVSNEHIQRLSHCSPTDAIIELIWNSVDASATRISLDVERNDLRGIESITITDNGEGISVDQVEAAFGNLGSSIKTEQTQNARGKLVHGKLGQGRFRAFSLGTKVQWNTKHASSNEVLVKGDVDHNQYFEIEPSQFKIKTKTGTVFKAENGYGDKLSIPPDDALLRSVMRVFAPRLLSDSEIQIKIGGKVIDPKTNIRAETTEGFDSPFENSRLKTVLWNEGGGKELYWCDKDFNSRHVERVDVGYGTYSLFLASPEVTKAITENTFDIRESTKLALLKDQAINKATAFVYKQNKDLAAETIKDLKDKGVYPYIGDAKTEMEKIERSMFDVCASKVIEAIPSVVTGNKDAQKLTLGLLRQSLESSPEALKQVLSEVLKLPKEEIEDLSELLTKVSLPGLIRLGRTVSDRLELLSGLRELVLSPDWAKRVLERKHLHKIVEGETWIFGEQFALGTSDETLNKVLEHHLELLGHGKDQYPDAKSEKGKGMVDIPDLVLGKQFITGAGDSYEHLVVELKRPTVKIGLSELAQINKYATTVSANVNFDKTKTKWLFWVLSSEVSEEALPQLSQSGREPGQYFVSKDGMVQVYVKAWAEVIQAANGRMEFLKKKLEMQTTKEGGLNYLKKKYPAIMRDIDVRKK